MPMPDLPEDERDDVGLQYVNPDVCYGGPVVAGSIILALRKGLLDPNNTDYL